MLECVINISEGRRVPVISVIAAAAGDRLLDLHHDPDHNRSVLTLAGEEAPRAVAAATIERLDLRLHEGVHPRIGVVDVVPFVAARGERHHRCAACPRRLREMGRGRAGSPVLPVRTGAIPARRPRWRVRVSAPGHGSCRAPPHGRRLRRRGTAAPGRLQPVARGRRSRPGPGPGPLPQGSAGPGARARGRRPGAGLDEPHRPRGRGAGRGPRPGGRDRQDRQGGAGGAAAGRGARRRSRRRGGRTWTSLRSGRSRPGSEARRDQPTLTAEVCGAGQSPLTADAATLALAHAAPDAELLPVGERVLEAVLTYDAAPADLLGLPGRRAPFREEQIGIDPQAVRRVLPGTVVFSGGLRAWTASSSPRPCGFDLAPEAPDARRPCRLRW